MEMIKFVRQSAGDEDVDVRSNCVASSLIIDDDDLPEALSSQASISEECRKGRRKVVLVKPVDLRVADRRSIERLRAIRDLTSCSVHVDWVLQGSGGFDLRRLFTFFPPRAIAGDQPSCDQWRNEFRYGLLYWRLGPGFISIRDSRQGRVNLLTLHHPAYIKAFLACVQGLPVCDEHAVACEDLEAEGVLCRVEDWLIALPFRMKHWPVPCNAV